MHDGQEVLQITATHDRFFAEFVDGSSQQVERAVYQKAIQEWGWQELSLLNRSWAHPSEKPKESGGWTDFMAHVMTRQNATRGVGVFFGFFVGITGEFVDPMDDGDFGSSFKIAQMVGVAVYFTGLI